MDNHSYIPTRKKRVRYKFITPNMVVDQKPGDNSISYFYQICTFPNPYDNMYHARKFTFTGKNEILDIKYYKLNKKQYKKFRRTAPPHRYACYNTYTLKNINFPTIAQLFTSKSNILETNYNYSGYAPFHKYYN